MTKADLFKILKDVPDGYTVIRDGIYRATGVTISPDKKTVEVV